jgi:hypothetical protein
MEEKWIFLLRREELIAYRHKKKFFFFLHFRFGNIFAVLRVLAFADELCVTQIQCC